jgi:hypothetical protein
MGGSSYVDDSKTSETEATDSTEAVVTPASTPAAEAEATKAEAQGETNG